MKIKNRKCLRKIKAFASIGRNFWHTWEHWNHLDPVNNLPKPLNLMWSCQPSYYNWYYTGLPLNMSTDTRNDRSYIRQESKKDTEREIVWERERGKDHKDIDFYLSYLSYGLLHFLKTLKMNLTILEPVNEMWILSITFFDLDQKKKYIPLTCPWP